MLEFLFHVEHPFEMNQPEIKSWLTRCSDQLGFHAGEVNYIFQSAEDHLALNKKSLNHDYYTDILTFDYRDTKNEDLVADIFLNVPFIKESAKEHSVSFDHELKRVMVHGLLHLYGQGDKTEKEKSEMRNLEEQYLSL